jgi:hypothetical protein
VSACTKMHELSAEGITSKWLQRRVAYSVQPFKITGSGKVLGQSSVLLYQPIIVNF